MNIKKTEGLLNELFRNNKTKIQFTIEEGLSNQEFISVLSDEFVKAHENIAQDIVRDIMGKHQKISRKYGRSIKGFNKRLHKRWNKPFNLLHIICLLSLEYGAEMWAAIAPTITEDDYLPWVLIKLHARACQISGEIFALIQSGYADGAMSRWRSLHETVMIAYFIEKHGKRTAEKYLKYTVIESYRAIKKYQEHCERFEYEPLSEEEIETIKQETQELCNEFGSSFKNPNGWASEELENNYPRFSQIEEDVDFSHYRPWYKMASLHTHSSPKTMEFSLGIPDGMEVISAGPSNIGLTDPGQNMAISLNQMNALLLSLSERVSQEMLFKSIVSIDILNKLCVRAQNSLLETEREIATDEEILSNPGPFNNFGELKQYLIVSIKDFLRYYL